MELVVRESIRIQIPEKGCYWPSTWRPKQTVQCSQSLVEARGTDEEPDWQLWLEFVSSEMPDGILRRTIGIICLFQGGKLFNYVLHLASNVEVVNLDLGRI